MVWKIREETNLPLHICKHAYEFCKDEKVAIEYLKLKYSAVSRKKLKNGKYVNFNDNDYLELARKNVSDI